MCLAIPMQVISRDQFEGTVELRGVRRKISLMLCTEAQVGKYVLVHAGYAITTVDEEEALRTLELFDELAREELPE